MNSYPLEFLAHPQPLMFVAGLGTDPPPPGPPGSSPSPAGSPPPAAASPGASGSSPTRAPSTPDRKGASTPDAEFATLLADLRATLRPYQRAPRVYLAPSERRQFRVELVEPRVQLPPRKAPAAASGDARAHSPLSPLTPASPMHPDGLIAPVWVRKHAEAVPAVFVAFMRLYETPARTGAGNSPLGEEMLADAERQAERQADDTLVAEIAERRRSLAERGVKLTVVLIASAQTLDSPGLDARLSSLRRAAGLGAKGSLFVLTPVPASELPDFVRSLQDALWDPAQEYYAAHGKRVRQKRGRVPSNIGERGGRARSGSSAAARARSGSFVRPLGQQGWIVRYDFKAGWFAEARGELDLARRHYEDCWNELARMFGSTTTLPPRTKRWAEAKVLADCVAIKICKLLLYEGAGSRVMVPFFVHVRRFADLSRGWGIGEETFEFWSWVARQYRLFGEVLELAVRSGVRVPPLPLPQTSTPTVPPTPEVLVSSVNPLHLLHPPAFYFYAAAACTMERRARFAAALAAEEETGAVALAGAPGFSNEKAVDHNALIIDLLTKAQALLGADARPGEVGLELYDAYRVAETYVAARKYAEGARYLAQIVGKFPADAWGRIRSELQALQLVCVRETGDAAAHAALLAQALPQPGERAAALHELGALMQKPPPAEPVAVDMPAGAGLLDVRAGFRLRDAPTGTPVAFQVTLASDADLSALPVTAARVVFSDGREIALSPGGDPFVDVGDMGSAGNAAASAALSFAPGARLVLSGRMSVDASAGDGASLEVADVVLCVGANGWALDVGLKPGALAVWSTRAGSYAPLSGLHAAVEITPRVPAVDVRLAHPAAAYVGEDVPVSVTVRSDAPAQLLVTAACGDDALRVARAGSSSGGEGDGRLALAVPAGETTEVLTVASPRAGECRVSVAVADADTEPATAAVAVAAPFRVSPSIRHMGPHAVVSAALKLGAHRPVTVKNITALGEGKVGDSLASESFPQTWTRDTAFALCARFALGGKVVPGLKVVWRPLPDESEGGGGERREASASSDDSPFRTTPAASGAGVAADADITTVIALPPIHAPQPDSFLTAEVAQPASVRLNEPFTLTLAVRNSHPAETVWGIVSGETSEHFVWAGPRGARVAVGPRSTQRVELELVAVSGVGTLAWPGVSVREGDGEDVEVRRSGIVILP